jgi:hypothetical protein
VKNVIKRKTVAIGLNFLDGLDKQRNLLPAKFHI